MPAILPCAASGQTTVFTTNTTIAATNLAYDGHTIVADGATLTVAGAHTFADLVITNAGVLTHATGETGLWISASSVVVTSNSTVDVSERGNAQLGSGRAGGSHGGRGGRYNGTSDPTHGDLRAPADLGSGGNGGYRGGGRVRITAGTLAIDGQVLADGRDATGNYTGAGGGGSIWLEAGTLTGAGSIAADGGHGTAYRTSGGGGGRIAIYYDDAGGFNLTHNVSCRGGTGYSAGQYYGGAGTVYLRDNAEPLGRVRIDNAGTGRSSASTDVAAAIREPLLITDAYATFAAGVTSSVVTVDNVTLVQQASWSVTNLAVTSST